MKVALFSLIRETKEGGSAVYSAHLYRALAMQGFEPVLLRVGAHSEGKARWFTHAVPYQNVSLQHACEWAATYPSLITYSHWKEHREACLVLLSQGVPIVIHDPAEFYDEMFGAVRSSGAKVIAIRRQNERALCSRGVEAVFVPHPYVPPERPTVACTKNAVCLGRVDFRKHHELICEANEQLPASRRVHIHGPLNRIFAYHTLDKRFSRWREQWHGPYPSQPDAAVRIMSTARWCVDLTVIKSGDGDGSQYTFMEAWDAGTPLIVHRNWIRTGKDEVRDGETAVAVADVKQLVDLLLTKPDQRLVEGGRDQLQSHLPESVVPRYAKALRWR